MNTQTYDLTLHGIDAELYQSLVKEAKTRGFSLNLTAKTMLRDSAGLGKQKKKYRDLSWMKNVMTKDEWDEFDKIIEEEFEQIDQEDWV